MQVKILLFGQLRKIAKERQCTLLISGSAQSLESVIAELCHRYDIEFTRELMCDKAIKKKWKVLVNGSMVKGSISDVSVAENSEIALIPILTGG